MKKKTPVAKKEDQIVPHNKLNITFDPPRNLRREKNTPWPGQPLIPTKINGYG